MAQKKRVPELRFRRFEGEWEEKIFQNLVTRVRTLSDNENLPRVEYEDILSGTGRLNKDIFKKESQKKGIEFVKGDILFGKLRPYLNNWLLPTFKGLAVGDFWVLRANDVNDKYVFPLIQSRNFQYVSNLSTGTKMPRADWAVVSSTSFSVPISLLEQSHIGSFFENLDDLIALHQRKHDKLIAVKKAMLEKMFPKEGADLPEIRFKGFAGKWEKKKIGDILTEKKRPIELVDNKQYELVTVKRRNEGVVSRGMLKGEDILVKDYYEIRAGDYLISKRQIVHGANGIVPQNLDKAIVSNEYLVAVGNTNIPTEFWTIISKLPGMYKKFFISSYGVDIEKLVFDVEDWKKRVVVIPKPAEQSRIIAFFQHLDSLISLHARELDKLKNIKKACLEKMFV